MYGRRRLRRHCHGLNCSDRRSSSSTARFAEFCTGLKRCAALLTETCRSGSRLRNGLPILLRNRLRLLIVPGYLLRLLILLRHLLLVLLRYLLRLLVLLRYLRLTCRNGSLSLFCHLELYDNAGNDKCQCENYAEPDDRHAAYNAACKIAEANCGRPDDKISLKYNAEDTADYSRNSGGDKRSGGFSRSGEYHAYHQSYQTENREEIAEHAEFVEKMRQNTARDRAYEGGNNDYRHVEFSARTYKRTDTDADSDSVDNALNDQYHTENNVSEITLYQRIQRNCQCDHDAEGAQLIGDMGH